MAITLCCTTVSPSIPKLSVGSIAKIRPSNDTSPTFIYLLYLLKNLCTLFCRCSVSISSFVISPARG